MRRLVATIAVIAMLGPSTGAAQQVVVTCPVGEPAPAVGVPMTWRAPDGALTEGVWFPGAKVVAIEQRLTGCEEKLGACAFDLKVEQAKVRMPGWVWVTAGLVVGLLAGLLAGKVAQ